jgi:hypothetical protein
MTRQRRRKTPRQGKCARLLRAREVEERKEASSEVVARTRASQRGAQKVGVRGNCGRKAAKRRGQRACALKGVARQRRGEQRQRRMRERARLGGGNDQPVLR